MVFNADGSLNFIEDLNHNRITAEYSSGLLTRLVHSAGQYLSFSYNGTVIGSITDNTGELSVVYSYSGENLAGVQDVLGRTTAYAYYQDGAASQALASVRMPDDTESNFAYDGNGRLSEMSFNGKPPVTIQYDTGSVIVTNTADQSTQRS